MVRRGAPWRRRGSPCWQKSTVGPLLAGRALLKKKLDLESSFFFEKKSRFGSYFLKKTRFGS